MFVTDPPAHLFIVGHDYHLGDLLWLTAVLADYRRKEPFGELIVQCPDRPISRILENNPIIDRLVLGSDERPGDVGAAAVHDLRPMALARGMLRDFRHRWPPLYYRDLWMQPRGQWLATYLHLGPLRTFRPTLRLREEDRAAARRLRAPYVALAPHIGEYRFVAARAFWHRVKGWDEANWTQLARLAREEGYDTVTLSAASQPPVPGTRALAGLPIRQAAGVIESAAALVSGESGLWFVAAACGTPFVIVPWWLPRPADWAAPMGVPHHLVRRDAARVSTVFAALRDLLPDRAAWEAGERARCEP